uniref:Uncharacterized protein n=1 Tax=Anguilla anguilla TaxID=7936 RepID=A0A0E9VDW8_ANGAN
MHDGKDSKVMLMCCGQVYEMWSTCSYDGYLLNRHSVGVGFLQTVDIILYS